MAVAAITGTVIAVRLSDDPENDSPTGQRGNITIKLDDHFGAVVLHVGAATADIQALTVPGTCTLAFSQP